MAHILNIGPSATSTAIAVFSGQIELVVDFIDTPTAFSVGATGTLSLLVGNIVATASRTVAAGGVLQLNENKRNNLAATAAPTVGDDYADGFREGSLWYDTVGVDLFLCVDPTIGAALWVLVS